MGPEDGAGLLLKNEASLHAYSTRGLWNLAA
jgi:hypothetical protein